MSLQRKAGLSDALVSRVTRKVAPKIPSVFPITNEQIIATLIGLVIVWLNPKSRTST